MAAAEPVETRIMKRIFLGSQGLRAGYRAVIFAVLALILGGIGAAVGKRLTMHLGDPWQAVSMLASEALGFLGVFIAASIFALFERRKVRVYGLPLRGAFGKHFWQGAAWGFGMLSVVIGCMAATHTYSAGTLAISGRDIVKYGVLWALTFLGVGLFEEYMFRGYLQYTLTWGMGFWPAAITTSILFALVHRGNKGETWFGLFSILVIAILLCTGLRRTGTLWWAVGWHMAWDWAQSFLYSVPDSGTYSYGCLLKSKISGNKWLSGGTVGPEASIFAVIVVAVAILIVAKLYPVAKYPQPDEAPLATPPPEAA